MRIQNFKLKLKGNRGIGNLNTALKIVPRDINSTKLNKVKGPPTAAVSVATVKWYTTGRHG